ncbi:MAG: hypothetical protein U9N83_06295, partial [Thermodesulfobacteriota bacterium]|nr:hypothetical protein [Thermodesulfobacteriota bacterium]
DRKDIFKDDKDRDSFLERLGDILAETQTSCFAWALIPNHFHLAKSICGSWDRKARKQESKKVRRSEKQKLGERR